MLFKRLGSSVPDSCSRSPKRKPKNRCNTQNVNSILPDLLNLTCLAGFFYRILRQEGTKVLISKRENQERKTANAQFAVTEPWDITLMPSHVNLAKHSLGATLTSQK